MPSNNDNNAIRNTSPVCRAASPEVEVSDIDLSLLEDSLSQTPWERMLANDDALNFSESLVAAMEKRNAKS